MILYLVLIIVCTYDEHITEISFAAFQDVHVMIFIGFGFLMTFLKKYGLSAVSLNMMIAVICLQWATLVIGFFHMHNGKIHLNLTDR